ncbi:MAG: adenylate/guanylate cyclase domain-containing protein [Reyranellaceae bacterium]
MEHLFGLLDEAETGAETDVAALERLLWRRFGRKGAAFVLDMAGTSRAVRERGIVPMLLRIRRMQRLGVPIVEGNSGELVKAEADNLFAFFRHVRPAVDAAIAMQNALADYNREQPPEWRIEACIGIAQGRALVLPGQDLFGDCVNIAAKLGEDLAQPGEILVALQAFSRLDDASAYSTEDLSLTVSDLLIEAVRVSY